MCLVCKLCLFFQTLEYRNNYGEKVAMGRILSDFFFFKRRLLQVFLMVYHWKAVLSWVHQIVHWVCLFRSSMSVYVICCALQRFKVAVKNCITTFKSGETSCYVYIHKNKQTSIYINTRCVPPQFSPIESQP